MYNMVLAYSCRICAKGLSTKYKSTGLRRYSNIGCLSAGWVGDQIDEMINKALLYLIRQPIVRLGPTPDENVSPRPVSALASAYCLF